MTGPNMEKVIPRLKNSKVELDMFKRNIDLVEFAASYGYVKDVKESSKASTVMRHPSGDKIVIGKEASDHHYIYWSVRDESDNGTIVDFIQSRKGGSLGAARKELRAWEGSSNPSDHQIQVLSFRNVMDIRAKLSSMENVTSLSYLEVERMIPKAILSGDRFYGCIKRDAKGNAVFPHTGLDGYTGYEIKNSSFTGFSKGGEKGLWLSNSLPSDTRLVIAETAIDALSYAALNPDSNTRYASTGGALSLNQRVMLKNLFLTLPAKFEIILAMDNDDGGKKLASNIEALVEVSESKCRLVHHYPPREGQDWNDVLRE